MSMDGILSLYYWSLSDEIIIFLILKKYVIHLLKKTNSFLLDFILFLPIILNFEIEINFHLIK